MTFAQQQATFSHLQPFLTVRVGQITRFCNLHLECYNSVFIIFSTKVVFIDNPLCGILSIRETP